MTGKATLTTGAWASFKGWSKIGGFLLMLGVCIPYLLLLRAMKSKKADIFPRQFHGVLMRMIGFKVRVHGHVAHAATGPILFVSNHSSYLDIPVLGSVIDGCFVAKSEVASWPFIGGLARLQNTVFVERRAVRAAKHRDEMRDCLEAGKSLIVFPEGTSSDGMRTLPFKSTLFSVVEKPLADGRKVQVQPISILCTEIGGLPIGRSWRPYYAWYGDMTLVKHGWDMFKIGSFTVDVILHPAVSVDDFGNRKLLSAYCERAIAAGVDQCVTGRFDKPLAVPA